MKKVLAILAVVAIISLSSNKANAQLIKTEVGVGSVGVGYTYLSDSSLSVFSLEYMTTNIVRTPIQLFTSIMVGRDDIMRPMSNSYTGLGLGVVAYKYFKVGVVGSIYDVWSGVDTKEVNGAKIYPNSLMKATCVSEKNVGMLVGLNLPLFQERIILGSTYNTINKNIGFSVSVTL